MNKTELNEVKNIKKSFLDFKRESRIYRPLFYNGYECEKIIFFSKGKIIYTSLSGFLEDETSKISKDITQIFLKNNFKKVNKVNLNKKENFFVTGERDFKFKKGFVFYINLDIENINISFSNYEHKFNTDTGEVLYKYAFIEGNFLVNDYKLNDKKELEYIEVNKDKIKVYLEQKFIKNEIGLKIEKLKKHYEKNKDKTNIKLSSYDIENLLKIFKINIKKLE